MPRERNLNYLYRTPNRPDGTVMVELMLSEYLDIAYRCQVIGHEEILDRVLEVAVLLKTGRNLPAELIADIQRDTEGAITIEGA